MAEPENITLKCCGCGADIVVPAQYCHSFMACGDCAPGVMARIRGRVEGLESFQDSLPRYEIPAKYPSPWNQDVIDAEKIQSRLHSYCENGSNWLRHAYCNSGVVNRAMRAAANEGLGQELMLEAIARAAIDAMNNANDALQREKESLLFRVPNSR